MKISVSNCGDVSEACKKAYLTALRRNTSVSFIFNGYLSITVSPNEARQELPRILKNSIRDDYKTIERILDSLTEIPEIKRNIAKDKNILKKVMLSRPAPKKHIRNRALENFWKGVFKDK